MKTTTIIIRSIITVLVLLLSTNGFSQDNININYTPLTRTAPPQKIIENFSQIPTLKVDKYQKEFKEISETLNKYIKDNLDSTKYYFDDIIYPYIIQITDHIYKNNPILNHLDFKILLSRSSAPNAFAFPNGYIEVNMGLLRYLEHEDELAFIIAHEMSHVYLEHSIKANILYLDKVNSDEFKKEVASIKKSEFQRYSKANELAKKLVYNDRKHSREYEFEADSLALLLLANTKFSINKGVDGMLLLKNMDSEKIKDSLLLSEIFHTENYPFKPRWIRENSFIKSTDTLSSAQLDSLKTHPDTELRHQHLLKILETQLSNIPNRETKNSTTFEFIRSIADFECLSNLYHDEVISSSTYLNLKLLLKYPENKFLKEMLIKNLQKIKEGLDEMKLSNYIQSPNPFHTGDYKLLILLLNSIRPSEIDMIIKEMSQKYSFN